MLNLHRRTSLFDLLFEGHELGIEIRNQIIGREGKARGGIETLALRRTDTCGAALNPICAGGTEKKTPRRDVIYRRFDESLRVVFVTLENVGANDRPIGECEQVLIAILHLIVSDEHGEIELQHTPGLLEVGEPTGRA